MSQRSQSGGASSRKKPTVSERIRQTWSAPERECPWCGSWNTEAVQRGLIGGRQSKDQYVQCLDCGRKTYEIVALNDRDIRVNRYVVNGEYRDTSRQTRYTIYRILKVGFNEFLLYLRPILPADGNTQ